MLVIYWAAFQRDRFDPLQRDLPAEYTRTGTVSAELYKSPLQRWENPGKPLFDRLVKEQGYDYETIKATGSQAVMQHHFLKTWFVVRKEGALIPGVEKAKDAGSARFIISQISDLLADKEQFQK